MTPVIPVVLDLNKIFNFLAGCSEDFKKQVTKDIQFLAAGDSHGLVEPDAAKNLLELFGPSSDHPLCLKEIKSVYSTQYPRLEKTKTGECIAYYMFGDLPTDRPTTIKDMQSVISFEAKADRKERKIKLDKVLGAPNQSFLAFFYHTCCAKDSDSIPLSSLTVIRSLDVAMVKNTLQSMEKHSADNSLHHNDGQNKYFPMNELGLEVCHHRIQHILLEKHDCGSKPQIGQPG